MPGFGQLPLTVAIQYDPYRTVDFDSVFGCGISGIQIIGHEYRVTFGTAYEWRRLPRIEMWIRRFEIAIHLVDGEIEFGNVSRTTFEFIKNGLRDEYLTGQFEQR